VGAVLKTIFRAELHEMMNFEAILNVVDLNFCPELHYQKFLNVLIYKILIILDLVLNEMTPKVQSKQKNNKTNFNQT
jgi:hypothetical protein